MKTFICTFKETVQVVTNSTKTIKARNIQKASNKLLMLLKNKGKVKAVPSFTIREVRAEEKKRVYKKRGSK